MLGAVSGAAFGSAGKFVLLTNQDTSFSVTGTWTNVFPPATYQSTNPTFYGEFYRRVAASGGATTATAIWEFGLLGSFVPGPYAFDAFIPDNLDNSGTAVVYRLESAPFGLFSGCGAYTIDTTFTGVNADSFEGRWVSIGTATVQPFTCYRLVLTNQGNAGSFILANAVRAERQFESSSTVVDIPRVNTAFAAATTNITSNSNAVPTIVTTLTVTCPRAGNVVVTGSGESAAVSTVAGTAFNGLAYSISKGSVATDNTNVVQSSSLATFNGDANRDFLNVQRYDTCVEGESITYRLTGYRAQPATGTSSFIWNGRLIANYFATTF